MAGKKNHFPQLWYPQDRATFGITFVIESGMPKILILLILIKRLFHIWDLIWTIIRSNIQMIQIHCKIKYWSRFNNPKGISHCYLSRIYRKIHHVNVSDVQTSQISLGQIVFAMFICPSSSLSARESSVDPLFLLLSFFLLIFPLPPHLFPYRSIGFSPGWGQPELNQN